MNKKADIKPDLDVADTDFQATVDQALLAGLDKGPYKKFEASLDKVSEQLDVIQSDGWKRDGTLTSLGSTEIAHHDELVSHHDKLAGQLKSIQDALAALPSKFPRGSRSQSESGPWQNLNALLVVLLVGLFLGVGSTWLWFGQSVDPRLANLGRAFHQKVFTGELKGQAVRNVYKQVGLKFPKEK